MTLVRFSWSTFGALITLATSLGLVGAGVSFLLYIPQARLAPLATFVGFTIVLGIIFGAVAAGIAGRKNIARVVGLIGHTALAVLFFGLAAKAASEWLVRSERKSVPTMFGCAFFGLVEGLIALLLVNAPLVAEFRRISTQDPNLGVSVPEERSEPDS